MTTDTPVIDLDDTDDNANWLRIVARDHPHLEHDPALHGNDNLSNPVDTYAKVFGKAFAETPVESATAEQLRGTIKRIRGEKHGNHPSVATHLDAAEHYLHKHDTEFSQKHHHLQHAREEVLHGMGALSTINALTGPPLPPGSPTPPVIESGDFDEGSETT